MADRAVSHVDSGLVMTVKGPIPVSEMGFTLMHEHILNDCRCWWHKPKEPSRSYLACEPVHAGILGELRMDPFVNLDNIRLDDEPLAIAELMQVANLGGRTVVDPTCQGVGRNAPALRRISEETGLNLVLGAGYYLQASHPPTVATMSIDDIADEIVRDAVEGVDGTDIRIGLIGEVGVSSDFTPDERKSLRGATRAHVRTGLPLMVHLPGWFRLAHEVLDIVAEEGGDLRHTVLCHMNPSGEDFDYQTSLAARGAFIEYDMIGMELFYADQGVQCPSEEDDARAITRLIRQGFLDRILLSQDTFLKMMLTRYGGYGYAHIQRHFLSRLARHGVPADAVATLMVANPRRVFSNL